MFSFHDVNYHLKRRPSVFYDNTNKVFDGTEFFKSFSSSEIFVRIDGHHRSIGSVESCHDELMMGRTVVDNISNTSIEIRSYFIVDEL